MPLVNFTLKLVTAFLLGFAATSQAIDLSVDDLLKNYSRLAGRRVTVVGLAEVNGSDFYLWDLQDSTHKRQSGAVSVLWDMRLPNYPPGSNIAHYTYLNLRRVRVTGLVDTHFHGRWGDIPFGFDLKRVDVVAGPRQRQFLRNLGVFHNSMSVGVWVRLERRRRANEWTDMELAPGGYNDTEIEDGFAVVTSLSGKPIAKCKIAVGEASRRYYDSRQHVYYYDIRNSRIKLVMPEEAKHWDLLPMVDRN